MIDITERFLKDIAERIGPERIEEVRLFPPIRQGGTETAVAIIASSAQPNPWHTVYSARYRHTLKGAERGKWEVEVTAEADAPLVTVDEVVRGVMKRAGEQFEPERITAGEFRTIVGYTVRNPGKETRTTTEENELPADR